MSFYLQIEAYWTCWLYSFIVRIFKFVLFSWILIRQSWVMKEKGRVLSAQKRWIWLISNWSLASAAMRFDTVYYFALEKDFVFLIVGRIDTNSCFTFLINLLLLMLCWSFVHFVTDMCLVLASHYGHGWKGWHRGAVSCMSFTLW